MLGPIDYIVLGFEGNNFNGSILAELRKAVENKTIRVIDLVFVMKDEDGNLLMGELEEQEDEIKAELAVFELDDDMSLVANSDIEKVASSMENNTAAAILVIEHLWALGLKKAIADAGGFLITDGRIHQDDVAAALEELDTLEV